MSERNSIKMKKRKHLNIDLDFLEDHPSKSSPPTKKSSEHKQKTNWKNVFIVVGIIIFIIWVSSSSDSSTSSSNSTNNYVSVGDYTCTQYHSNQVNLLLPKITLKEIKDEENLLENRSNQLDSLKRDLESFNINEYSSQYNINRYNTLVDDYNLKSASFKRVAASYESKIDDYNKKIGAYNNYLSKNCTKK